MTYRITLARHANSYLERLEVETQERFADLFERLAEAPMEHSKQLTGRGGRRSARVGAWRVILQIDAPNREILVSDIGPRGQVYRRL
ncbi:MAG: hypothetical protein C0506_10165 [Anaerolinea sp.]|nr:hypothetical protein [Anaerolinea sp.]